MIEEIDLPSGAKLKVQEAPFKEARNLYQACMEEAGQLKLDPEAEVDINLFKDLFCKGFSSKKIEMALDVCMKRARYNDLPITDDTWEPVEARQDYWVVCFEVARVNISPFAKGLYAKLSLLEAMIQKLLA